MYAKGQHLFFCYVKINVQFARIIQTLTYNRKKNHYSNKNRLKSPVYYCALEIEFSLVSLRFLFQTHNFFSLCFL